MKYQKLQLKTLDEHLSKIAICDAPVDGWIRAIRQSLGMSARQLSERLGISQQSAAKLESNEADKSITLRSLNRAAQAMQCKVVYAIIPEKGDLKGIVKKQAFKKAKELISPVQHTMVLEDQEVKDPQDQLERISEDLVEQPNKLWD